MTKAPENLEDFLSNLFKLHSVERCEIFIYDSKREILDQPRERIKYIDANEFTDHLNFLQLNLKKDEEVAIRSRVYRQDNDFHIPMIDFLTPSLKKQDISEIKNIMRDVGLNSSAIFSSGRSYHLYASRLINDKRWAEFMGRTLSHNRKNLIDAKWVGACLQLGYSVLRLTNNSGNYIKAPEFVQWVDF